MIQKSEAVVQAEMSAFRASRIYAEGWNAARGTTEPSRNPYGHEPERSRWNEGFAKGLA